MVNFFLKIYDYLQKKRLLFFAILFLSLIILISRALTLEYKEDIYDFLPIDSRHQKSLNIFQNLSSAEKIFIIFRHKDSTIVEQDKIVEAMENFGELLMETDTMGLSEGFTLSIDIDKYRDVTNNIYRHIPYFLTLEDYNRLDSVITPTYIKEQVKQVKSLLLLPSGGLLTENIQKDPLNIFTPVISKLQGFNNTTNYELYDGYIFTPDKKKAIAMLASPYGSGETANNGKLIEYLNTIIKELEVQMPGITAHLTGAPVIAVGNATQIKNDSIIAILFAVFSILALLLYSFRSIKELLYIAASIMFGWVFAMAAISLFNSQISMIVIGISSIFIGIAVNYPLHLIAHTRHLNDIRSSLKDIIPPLIVGNITTVGAFMCLVPLKSVALRDLGLFGSFMLIGTILFVILFLPQILGRNKGANHKERMLLPNLISFNFENKKWIIRVLLLVTIPLAYYSTQTKFDANMQSINYMTEEQREDFNELQATISSKQNTLFLVYEDSLLDNALKGSENNSHYFDKLQADGTISQFNSITTFCPSVYEQERRIEEWNRFIEKKGYLLNTILREELASNGFQEEAFDQYFNIIDGTYVAGAPDFREVLGEISAQHICNLNGNNYVVDKVSVPYEETESVKKNIMTHLPDVHCFDVSSISNAISQTLSDEFNYIGISCGIIVFIFLWFSFGRIELSIMAFLPMAISWVWILGIMGITDIRFNIVNVILATFIFGQGDDYTIFMSEGLIDEYAYRKKLLASYKNSIIMSALIMFLGIGCLIITEHPALKSLAEVTIVGMAVVVLTAYIIPPLVFRTLNYHKGQQRVYPLTLERLAVTMLGTLILLADILIGVIVATLMLATGNSRPLWKHKVLDRINHLMAKIGRCCLFGINISVNNLHNESFNKGSVIICNSPSILNILLIRSIRPGMLIRHNISSNRIVNGILNYAGFCFSGEKRDDWKGLIEEGFHICTFCDNTALQFGEEIFSIAEELNADIVPIIIYGTDIIMPQGCVIASRGSVTLEIGKRIELPDGAYGTDSRERADNINRVYGEWKDSLSSKIENTGYYKYFVKSRYFYKGLMAEIETSRLIKKHSCFTQWIDTAVDADKIIIVNNGYGVLGLLFSLVHKDKNIYVTESDCDKFILSRNVSCKPHNLHFIEDGSIDEALLLNSRIYIYSPTESQIQQFSNYNITIIK